MSHINNILHCISCRFTKITYAFHYYVVNIKFMLKIGEKYCRMKQNDDEMLLYCSLDPYTEKKPSFRWSPAPALSEENNLILRLDLEKLAKTFFGPKGKLRFFRRNFFWPFLLRPKTEFLWEKSEKSHDWIWRNWSKWPFLGQKGEI